MRVRKIELWAARIKIHDVKSALNRAASWRHITCDRCLALRALPVLRLYGTSEAEALLIASNPIFWGSVRGDGTGFGELRGGCFRVRDNFMGTVFGHFWSVIDAWVALKLQG